MQLRALAVRASFCLFVTTLGAAAVGCDIRHNDRYCDSDEHEDEDDCEKRPDKAPAPAPITTTPATPAPVNALCDSFCDRLVVCGSIRAASVVACRADCQAGYLADPVGTRAGCACVERDACRPVTEYACPGAPLPPGDPGPGPGAGTGGSSGGGGGATGTGGTSGGSSGSAGGAAAECTASCQCDEGEACTGGRCVANTPPPPQCATDCDCLKGQRCVAGACE